MRLTCPTCNGDAYLTTEDRHARTDKDVCPTCKGAGDILARTGETPEAAYKPDVPIIEPGQAFYEARFENRGKHFNAEADTWEDLPLAAKSKWAQAEERYHKAMPFETKARSLANSLIDGIAAANPHTAISTEDRETAVQEIIKIIQDIANDINKHVVK